MVLAPAPICCRDSEICEAICGLRVTFLQDAYAPERLRKLDLNERQSKAVLYVKEHGNIRSRFLQAFLLNSKLSAQPSQSRQGDFPEIP